MAEVIYEIGFIVDEEKMELLERLVKNVLLDNFDDKEYIHHMELYKIERFCKLSRVIGYPKGEKNESTTKD
jgi:uncharacterized radical SAM superfamily protein